MLVYVVTARIQRTREGNIFSLSTLAGGGGYPFPGQDWGGGGYPIPRSGCEDTLGCAPHSGCPRSGWEGGNPHPELDGGTPLSRAGWGTSPPPHGQDWMGYLPPNREQHSEHLLQGGRYASCVHVGELSCFK